MPDAADDAPEIPTPVVMDPPPPPRTGLRLIVCGGRRFADRAAVFVALDHLHATRVVSMVIEGGADGADALARHWANVRGVPCETVKADWATFGKSAGPLRNRHMLGLGPHGVVAFPGGRGTADMCAQAERAGVRVWRPAGRVPVRA
ncbi:MAG TPA: DUF2493 domain-containing protein [Humisphaera sp.]